MNSRLRTILRLLLLLAAVALIVIGRTELGYRPVLDALLRPLDPLGALLGGAFAGITLAFNALPFFLVVAGCVLAGCLLTLPEPRRVLWPAVALSSRGRAGMVPMALIVVAVVLAAGSAALLREPEPGKVAVFAWWAAVVFIGVSAWQLDRARGTRMGSPLFERRDWLAALLLFGIDLLLVAHDVSHWRWMGTPDEANFFPFAQEIVQGRSNHFILLETGMYGVHPLLSSYYQAAFMWVFGDDIFGWRLSSAFALAASLPCVYVLGRELWDRRAGACAAILFGTTPLAVGFAHFGYNNAQIFLFITASLAMLAWAMRRRSLFAYYLAGAIAGLAVFTFYPARMALPLLFLLAFAVGEMPWRARRLEWAMLLAAAVIAAIPCLVHPQATLERMFGQTAFHVPDGQAEGAATKTGGESPSLTEEISAAVAGKGGRLLRHLNVSLFFPLWYPNPSHFQTCSVIDPLQGVLAVIGLVLTWRGFRRDAGCRFLALAYLFSAVAVGTVSQHDCPPLTRLLFLCPFVALLAALSLRQIAAGINAQLRSPRLAATVVGVLLAVSAAWGIGILRYNVYVRNHGYGEGTTSELARLLRALPPSWRVVYVQRMPTYMSGVDASLAQHGWDKRFAYLRDSPEIVKHMPPSSERELLLVHDLPVGESRQRFEAAMSERFPGRTWRQTAPGKSWDLHVLAVANDGDGGWQPPLLPKRSDLGLMVFGFLDW